jgi:hypothetical protein
MRAGIGAQAFEHTFREGMVERRLRWRDGAAKDLSGGGRYLSQNRSLADLENQTR